MKKQFLITATLALLITVQTFAQSPQSFKYQTVVRDNSGNVMANQNTSFRLYILQGTITGPSMYIETHNLTTNSFGLANLDIGGGTVVSGAFNSIDWSSGPYFLKIELDATGGTNYTLMGTSQLLSVPYSLYAEKAGNIPYSDTSATNELQTLSQAGTNITLSNGGGTVSFNDGDTTYWKNDNGDIYYGMGSVGIRSGNHLRIYNAANTSYASLYMHPGGNYIEENYTLKISNGDTYISNSASGVILTSPDNTCWRVTIDNSGNLMPTSITCP